MALESLRLTDFSDRELLLILRDVADADGWADARTIAERIDLRKEHPHRFVSARLGWLSAGRLFRDGAVEREFLYDEHGKPKMTRAGKHRYTQRWRLTPLGGAIALGTLKRGQQSALDGLRDEQLVVALRVLGTHVRSSNDTARVLSQREWRWGMAQNGGSR